MRFTVLDTKTGKEADTYKIALKEEWAKSLCYCDMEGFAVEEDGTLLLVDECGKFEYCPEGRFKIVPEIETNADKIRQMNDEDLAYLISCPYEIYPPWCKEKEECPYVDEEDVPCHKCALEWIQRDVSI